MLDGFDELGVFILVLANASFDPRIWRRLQGHLHSRFEELKAQVERADNAGLVLDDAKDDLVVFRRLMAIGIAQLQLTEFRFGGPWELQFNPLRALRPPRMTGQRVEGIRTPFNHDGFHFNRAYLRKEMIWRGDLLGRDCRLFYNKFPFVDLHALLVPDAAECRPQFLEQRDHADLWRLTLQLAETLPGVGFGYNSYGACASVNHLHFQMFHRERPLPVTQPEWAHNGGSRYYPLELYWYDDMDAAWGWIESMHQRKISYNLLYLPGRIYCMPRQKQGSVELPEWSAGLAWYELAGGFTTFSRPVFDALQDRQIEQVLMTIALDHNKI